MSEVSLSARVTSNRQRIVKNTIDGWTFCSFCIIQMQIKCVIISVRHDFLLFAIWTWNLRDSLKVVRLIRKTWTVLAIKNWVALLRNFFLNCERGVFNSSLPCSGTLLRKPGIFYFQVKFWRLLFIKIFKFFLQRTLQLNVTFICVVRQQVLLDVFIGSDRTS